MCAQYLKRKPTFNVNSRINGNIFKYAHMATAKAWKKEVKWALQT